MKKLFLLIAVFCLVSITVQAADFPSIKYKNIPNKAAISYSQDTQKWIDKADKKSSEAYIKTLTDTGYVFQKNSNGITFSTGCDYEFVVNGSLIGFSNNDLKFYKFKYDDENLTKEELSPEEIQAFIPNYRIIKISDFSDKTNVYKIKKHAGNLKIFILNDTDKTFENYAFSSGNSAYKKYDLNGFIDVSKKGMIEFSSNSDNSKELPWFIILVR